MSFPATIGLKRLSFVPFELEAFSSIEYNLKNVKIAKNEQKWTKSRYGNASDWTKGYTPVFSGSLNTML
jgi:hypothetical protein